MPAAASSLLPIAIIGGGPAGLTAARVLQLQGVPCRVYENEAGPTARNQGGSLDLHEKDGLWAIEQCGLTEQFHRLSRPEGDCMRIMNKTGAVLYREEPPQVEEGQAVSGRGRPEIDRLVLRNLLLDSLQPGTVQWGHALASLQPLPADEDADGVCRWELTFKSGATERAAVVIGADGAWSRVRPVLSSAVPRYTGVTFLDCTIPHVAARHPQIADMVGPGSAFVLDDQRAIIAQKNGNDVCRTYFSIKVPEAWADDESEQGGAFLKHMSGEAVETFVRRYFGDWHATTLDFIRQADVQSIVLRRIHALPYDHSFAHTAQSQLVTAVGDAAHVMGPNGEGVNMAMYDAAQLCLALARVLSPPSTAGAAPTARSPQQLASALSAAIADFERDMFARVAALADDPINFDFFLSEDAANKFVAMFQQMIQQASAEGQETQQEQASAAAEAVRSNPTIPS